MNKQTASLFTINPGKERTWSEWATALDGARRGEAISTLRAEGIIAEFFITIPTETQNYVLAVALTADGSEPAAADPNTPINIEHKAKKRECLTFVAEVPFDYLLQRSGD